MIICDKLVAVAPLWSIANGQSDDVIMELMNVSMFSWDDSYNDLHFGRLPNGQYTQI